MRVAAKDSRKLEKLLLAELKKNMLEMSESFCNFNTVNCQVPRNFVKCHAPSNYPSCHVPLTSTLNFKVGEFKVNGIKFFLYPLLNDPLLVAKIFRKFLPGIGM